MNVLLIVVFAGLILYGLATALGMALGTAFFLADIMGKNRRMAVPIILAVTFFVAALWSATDGSNSGLLALVALSLVPITYKWARRE